MIGSVGESGPLVPHPTGCFIGSEWGLYGHVDRQPCRFCASFPARNFLGLPWFGWPHRDWSLSFIRSRLALPTPQSHTQGGRNQLHTVLMTINRFLPVMLPLQYLLTRYYDCHKLIISFILSSILRGGFCCFLRVKPSILSCGGFETPTVA